MKGLMVIFILAVFLAVPICSFGEDEKKEEVDWTKYAAITGLIDGRVTFYNFDPDAKNADSFRTSDVYIRFASLGVEYTFNDYVGGSILVTAEDPDLFYLDHAYVKLQYPWVVTPSFTIGRVCVCRGSFATYAIEYPFPQVLFESYMTAIGVGLEYPYFSYETYFFNGKFDNVDKDGEPADDIIDTVNMRLEVRPLAFQKDYQLNLGGMYLTDATETDFDLGSALLHDNYEKDVPLFGGFLTAVLPFTQMVGLGLIGEYAATGKFNKNNYLDNSGKETTISAYNLELALLLNDQTVQVGAKIEGINGVDWLGTQGFDPDYQVERYARYGGFLGFDPWKCLHLGLRYLAGQDNEQNRDGEAMFQTLLTF